MPPDLAPRSLADSAVCFDPVHAFDEDLLLLGIRNQHFAFGALSLPAMTSAPCRPLRTFIYNTLRASETIFMKRFAARGRPAEDTSPARPVVVLDDDGGVLPNRCSCCRTTTLLTVRTTTAFTTSPRLTLPPGMASLTVATMMSLIPA